MGRRDHPDHDPANDQPAVIGYMDLTDFECELGAAMGGNRVFPSVDDLRRCKSGCIDECGIVEVEVRFRRVIQPGRH
jgi:hypothetical protein